MVPNLNLFVSVLSLSSANHPRLVVPQPGLSSAAPKNIKTLESVPKISEKSADMSHYVGKSGNINKPLENTFPANPASESPLQKQQINVHHVNIERSSQSTIVTPKYNALCGMAKCYVMNPLNGMMHQIRVLLDSVAMALLLFFSGVYTSMSTFALSRSSSPPLTGLPELSLLSSFSSFIFLAFLACSIVMLCHLVLEVRKFVDDNVQVQKIQMKKTEHICTERNSLQKPASRKERKDVQTYR